MKINKKQLESKKSGMQCDYLVLEQLPSDFRSYDVKEVYVRGLFYGETLALSKYVGNIKKPNFTQLSSIYEDVISGIEIKDLELIDFIILMTISSIWTVDDFGWSPNIRCANTVDKKQCDGNITQKIVLDDFEFTESVVKNLPIPIEINNVKLDIGALTVGDMIKKEAYIESNPNIDKKIVDYAFMIKNDMKDDEKIKLIQYGSTSDIKQISQIDSEIYIKIKPILKQCPKCGHKNRLFIGLNQIKAYP